ncbi:MAG TPA: hypothetical protein VGL16_00185 [Actinomycetota bacterium]
MTVVTLGVLPVLHCARRRDVPGMTRVIGIPRVVCVSSVASMNGVALGRRRVTGVRAVSRVLRSLGLRVGRRPFMSHAVLGVVAHVVKLPNIREYALLPSRDLRRCP